MDSILNNKQYSVIVAGDVDLDKYDLNKKVKPYVVYKYDERGEIRKKAIQFHQEYLNNLEGDIFFLKDLINIKLQDIQEMTDEEYFESITNGMIYDEKTGDALTDINPNGKFYKLIEPSFESTIPFFENSFQCKKDEIPEFVIDEVKKEQYSKYWDNLMESSDKRMKDEYLELYSDKETFIIVMCEPFFYNAFVSEKTGWVEQCNGNQVEWIINFRKNFIDDLPGNTKLRIYNFIR